MTVKEIIKELERCNPDAPVLVGETNKGLTETYALADQVSPIPYGQVLTDLFHTFDGIDNRLLRLGIKEEEDVVYIGSLADLRYRDDKKCEDNGSTR